MELLVDRICQELALPRPGVAAVTALLNEGNTVPFIARYRKEATGSLDEVAIRAIEERLIYFKELLDRRETVIKTIDKQGKLTPELRGRIEAAWSKTELEDLYLPYKPKKRTKATDARERGLEPLLDALLADTSGADPLMLAAAYVKEGAEGLETPSQCVEGAGHILAERLAEDADVRAWLRQVFHDTGLLHAELREERKDASEALRFKPYWQFQEPLRKMPGHRILAVRRGEKEEILTVKLTVDREKLVTELVSRVKVEAGSAYRNLLHDVCGDAFDRLLAPTLETDVRVEAKKKADLEAIKVFQTNLDHLLLAPPAGQLCTLGVDPGIRTGCKLAVINRLGQFMETATIYPLEPKRDLEGSRAVLEQIAARHPVEAIAIGNGTGGREAEAFIREWLRDSGRDAVLCVSVSEAGASVYSASEVAREEFPEQDVTVRGAISIARRFQDPLAELVKVEPKSIGVGQYQHDVNQTALKKGLDEVVESCVNRVGVDLNSASYRLLSYVAGIGESLAKNIVQHRFANGAFRHREQLMDVPRFGEKAFLQAAGFLRIRDGENPLDASAVHPESYPVVQRICQVTGRTVPELVGNDAVLDGLDPATFTDATFGVETVRDIIAELKKPGRDPRQRFEAVTFREGVHKPSDLEVGMELQGIVTNVTDFGAFVDVGVHQDGLVHLSEISHQYVKNPADVLSVGQAVRVKVLAVDLQSKRIGLSIKALLPGAPRQAGPRPDRPARGPQGRPERGPQGGPRPDRRPEGRREGRPANPEGGARPRSGAPRPPAGKPAGQPQGSPKPPAPKPAPQKQGGAPATLSDLMAKYNRGLR
ncbi:Tex-like N-terminal domain-containing protein [Mesoterricola sediminis]|uniref:RNA-binding transcriptional accessory protein n=1 Tax=Mesoterricola sediminis TaxID=2927980 RepID=A0AA48KCV8_9BACT|nr:Tex-like N-terminal domain-containing protein [Mesoterricola sediminis]BDU77526.1 RNA-binding transcriptional accessory protein [Mesoterricola sediminis]